MSAYIDEHRGRFGVEPICRVLDVSASAYYERAGGRRSERTIADEQLVGVIRCTHEANYCAYGYRKMWLALNRAGHHVGRDHVKRLMRVHRIQGAKRRGKPWRTTIIDPSAARAPDLVNRDFSAERPDALWAADFTYLRCWEGVVFFSFVIDVFSRRIPVSAKPQPASAPVPSPHVQRASSPTQARALRIGIGGPVGSGKSSLIAALCRELAGQLRLGAVTNDIYTSEDAEFLRSTGVLAGERIVAVQTGCCPHTVIRDDITINLEAIEQLEHDQGPLDLVLVESGGDNLTAVFSPALADVQIFVIDVAGGDDIPRKGGPGIARADLLVINKTDLAPYVGSDVLRMISDAVARRGARPVLALSLTTPPKARPVADWTRA